jgi:hypothetical protein
MESFVRHFRVKLKDRVYSSYDSNEKDSYWLPSEEQYEKGESADGVAYGPQLQIHEFYTSSVLRLEVVFVVLDTLAAEATSNPAVSSKISNKSLAAKYEKLQKLREEMIAASTKAEGRSQAYGVVFDEAHLVRNYRVKNYCSYMKVFEFFGGTHAELYPTQANTRSPSVLAWQRKPVSYTLLLTATVASNKTHSASEIFDFACGITNRLAVTLNFEDDEELHEKGKELSGDRVLHVSDVGNKTIVAQTLFKHAFSDKSNGGQYGVAITEASPFLAAVLGNKRNTTSAITEANKYVTLIKQLHAALVTVGVGVIRGVASSTDMPLTDASRSFISTSNSASNADLFFWQQLPMLCRFETEVVETALKSTKPSANSEAGTVNDTNSDEESDDHCVETKNNEQRLEKSTRGVPGAFFVRSDGSLFPHTILSGQKVGMFAFYADGAVMQHRFRKLMGCDDKPSEVLSSFLNNENTNRAIKYKMSFDGKNPARDEEIVDGGFHSATLCDPSITKLCETLKAYAKRREGPAVVYCDKMFGALGIIHVLYRLKQFGFEPCGPKEENKFCEAAFDYRRVVVYAGTDKRLIIKDFGPFVVAEERDRLLNTSPKFNEKCEDCMGYNTNLNARGKSIAVIILSGAGDTGIELRNTRLMLFADLPADVTKLVQLAGRPARRSDYNDTGKLCGFTVDNDNDNDNGNDNDDDKKFTVAKYNNGLRPQVTYVALIPSLPVTGALTDLQRRWARMQKTIIPQLNIQNMAITDVAMNCALVKSKKGEHANKCALTCFYNQPVEKFTSGNFVNNRGRSNDNDFISLQPQEENEEPSLSRLVAAQFGERLAIELERL